MFILLFLTFSIADVSTKADYCIAKTDGTCTKCIDNYILVKGTCTYKRELGCEIFDYNGNEYFCKKCSHGFKMDFDTHTCVPGYEYCATEQIGLKQNCLECKPGYTKGMKTCVDCSEKNPYCEELDKSDDCMKCKKCAKGTKENEITGYCEIVNEFCKEFEVNQNIKCRICRKGYYRDSEGICRRGNIQGCEDYIDEKHCDKCLKGGYVKDGKCIDGCKSEHCSFCNATENTKCIECNEGYYITLEGKCSKCSTENCDYCGTLEDMGCSICMHGYYKTTDDECIKCDESCAECSTHGCVKCADGYYKNEKGICVSCGEGCYVCRNGQCLQCNQNEGYFRNLNGECEQFSDVNCFYVNASDMTCIACNQYHYLSSQGKCERCEIEHCGACSEVDENTVECDSCDVGFFVNSDGICEECKIDGCSHCNATDYCLICDSPDQQAYNGTCYARVDNCKVYDEESGLCIECYHPEKIVNKNTNRCTFKPCDVEDENDAQHCKKCNDQYYLTEDNTCDSCSVYCGDKGCTHDSTECNEEKTIPGCLLYSDQDRCLKCGSNYVLTSKGCEMAPDFESCHRTFTGRCFLCVWSNIDESGKETFKYSYPNENGECIKEEESKNEGSGAKGMIILFFLILLLISI